jgi:hypothetical protein
MAGQASTVGKILEEVERVVSSIDYDELEEGEVEEPSASKGTRKDEFDLAKEKKRGAWKKPTDKPKRPLSAYNIFFQLERERILSGEDIKKQVTAEQVAKVCFQHKLKKEKRRHRKTHGKIGFAELARTIANRWKGLSDEGKVVFDNCAVKEKFRYKKEVVEWTRKQHPTPKKEGKGVTFATNMPRLGRGCSSAVANPTRASNVSREQGTAGMPPHLHKQAPQQVGPTSDSLNRLMMQGRSYMHYQYLIEQQRILIEEEICHQQMMADQQQLPLPFPGAQGSLPPHFGGGMHYDDYHQEDDQAAYFNMADQSYQMAQLSLQFPPHLMSNPSAAAMGMLVQQQGGMMNRLREHDGLFAPVRQPHEITPTRPPPSLLAVQEQAPAATLLDSHTNLASPTFDPTETDNMLNLMDNFEDNFENA